MNTEFELRILEINKEEFINKIESLGAKCIGIFEQKRYVYDYIPKRDNEWIRLRTNGKETTLTLKKVEDKTIDGTKELEIVVNDFDKTNKILEKLGYKSKGFQENKRIEYILNNIHIDIDTWPMIPTYVEIEGLSRDDVINMIKYLGYKEEDTVTYGVTDIYNHYGFNGDKLTNLSFDMNKEDLCL